MIEVENLSKRYGSVPAVSDVSFRCTPGTVTGFVGPNGAGKSTTLRMICGLAEPSSGTSGAHGRGVGAPRGRRGGVGASAARRRLRATAPPRGDLLMRLRVMLLKAISRVAHLLRVFPPA
jgi:ABC-2 type transport system ATP-binding protein